MNALTKLPAVLTAIFTLCFCVLMAELIYVLWWRRRFREQNISGSEGSRMSGATFNLPSKELLYFFCWKNKSSQVEPSATPPALMDVSRDSEAAKDDDDDDDDDLEKLQALYVSSRLLYTIKEEEKEGRDSSEYSVETESKSRWTLGDALTAMALSEAALAAVDEVEAETPYYTPSPSPGHEESVIPAESVASGREETEKVTDFVSLLIKDELSLAGNITDPTK
ncbi:hypothetical protein SLE2022_125050 [Rubroshorea leprosula]